MSALREDLDLAMAVIEDLETTLGNVWRERLSDLFDTRFDNDGELEKEGFPGMDPGEFVKRFFIDAQGMSEHDEVTRIVWRYLDGDDQ